MRSLNTAWAAGRAGKCRCSARSAELSQALTRVNTSVRGLRFWPGSVLLHAPHTPWHALLSPFTSASVLTCLFATPDTADCAAQLAFCAGGGDSTLVLKVEQEAVPPGYVGEC